MRAYVDGEYVDVEDVDIPEMPIEEQIIEAKAELASLDYIGIKIAEGVATKEEYAEELARKVELRKRINELEAMLPDVAEEGDTE